MQWIDENSENSPIYSGGMLPEMVISADKNTGLIRLNKVPHIAVKKSKLLKNAGDLWKLLYGIPCYCLV